MYNVGEIFYQDAEYSARAKFCNENGYLIKEIEPDVKGRRFQIQNLPEATQSEKLEALRCKRNDECFTVVNRGQVWYETLSEMQKAELKIWYLQWLDVTETLAVPSKPTWLK